MTSLQFDEWQDSGGTPVLRFNAGALEVWDGSAWAAASGVAPWAEINETPTGTFSDGTDDWNYWIYKSSGTLTVNTAGRVDYVVVAGGGTGSSENTRDNVGSGGAGGVIESCEYAQIDAGSYAVTIGSGGAATTSVNSSNNGSNSSIGSLAIAIGGGGAGDTRASKGKDGGCGGGAGDAYGQSAAMPGGDGTFNQGFRGGTFSLIGNTGGAGGGAGGAGSDGLDGASRSLVVGGVGRTTTIITASIATSESVGEVDSGNLYFAGGGGAGLGSAGGLGGGGDGAPDNQRGVDCPANTGGGSGNSDTNEGSPYAGAGGSGVVIVRTRS